MTNLRKHLIRFGLVLGVVSPLMVFAQGANSLKIVTYKICLVLLGVGLSELVWSVFFRPVYGKSEEMSDNERQAYMLFRGMLYSAIILALTLGL